MSLSIRADSLGGIPLPFNWEPTTDFDGVDGRWSTFFINVGDDQAATLGQDFRILPATGAGQTVIPGLISGIESWCTDYTGGEVECAKARGIENYRSQTSLGFAMNHSSWQYKGIYNLALAENVDFGQNQNASWGYDFVGLGRASASSQVLRNQPIAVAQSQPFFLGLFGLSNVPINFGEERSVKTFMTEWKDSNNSATLSYGYTAGAWYAHGGKGVPGSLVLGGYDESRFDISRQVTSSIPPSQILQLGVRQITVGPGSNPQNIPNSRFLATVDSTLPYIWLPRSVCDTISDHYELSYDDEAQLYFINSTNGPEDDMIIQIGNNADDPNYINIVLPFSALNQASDWPHSQNQTQYFPMKRAANDDSFVLGRAFLQQAYIMVDYDKRNFTIASINYTDPMPEPRIVQVLPVGYQQSGSSSNSRGLSKRAIGGIVGGVAGVILMVIVALLFVRRRRNQKDRNISDHKANVGFYGEHPASPPPQYANEKPPNVRRASELEDGSSRSTSAQGCYYNGHRHSESGSNITELMGSPPIGSDEKAYLKQAALETEPAPLAELPGDHGLSELPPARRPKPKRHRSSGSGGSNGRIQSPESERPDPIQEEEHSPIERRVTTLK